MKITQITFQSHQSIKMIATQLGVKSRTDCLEEIIELPKQHGKGCITGFQFSDGVGLLLFNCKFKEDWTILFNQNIVPPLQFNFSIKGGVKHFYNHSSIQYFLNPLQGTITADLPESHHGFQFPSNQQIVFACLMIEREKYVQKIDCILEKMPEKLANVFSDTRAKNAFFYQGNYSITSSECIQTILTDQNTGLVRSTYMEGIALELLSGQIKQFRDDLVPPSKQVTLRKQDVEKILEAKDFLLENLKDPPTIEGLSKEVGINQSKLKIGFKKVFDKPVKSWLRDKRLEMAKLLLLQKKLSIRDIAFAIGYSNQSHFSNRFREKYGVLPKDFLQSVKVKLSDFQQIEQ